MRSARDVADPEFQLGDRSRSTGDENLTLLPTKRALFAHDIYFREALHDVSEMSAAQRRQILDRHTLLFFKPDAVVGRKMELTLQLARTLEYRPVWFRRFRITRHVMRAMWQYSWNEAAQARVELSTVLNQMCDTLCVILRRDTVRPLPAAVELALRKGSADPARRKASDLRSRLGAPNRVLSFIHCSDEPADFLRELAVICDVDERRRVFGALLAGEDLAAPDALLRAITEIEAQIEARDLDVVWATETVRGSSERMARLLDILQHKDGAEETLQSEAISILLRFLRAAADPVLQWDLICCISHVLLQDPPNSRALISDECARAWIARGGEDA
jgi:hypothetical protein